MQGEARSINGGVAKFYADEQGNYYTFFNGLNLDPRDSKVVETFTSPSDHQKRGSFGQPIEYVGANLIGQTLSHRARQLLAMGHARKNLGFDSQVAFVVNWGDMAPSFFVYGENQEWLQLSAEGCIVLPDSLWPRYTSRHPGIDSSTVFFE